MTAEEFDRPIWGAPAIAKIINKSTDATEHMLIKGQLDASKVGGKWVSTPRRLMASLSKPFEARRAG
ncbi:MAG TPA: hypothetical protein VL198_03315 [Pseudolabrys sp.]|jgi:hypothetical protein|nr:hypothetical protein [Pseudolabrys sp.]